MPYPAELADIKGIGISTASKLAEKYRNKEDLLVSIQNKKFSFGKRLLAVLTDHYEVAVPTGRPQIRSTQRQPITINFGVDSFLVTNRFTEVPEDKVALFDSSDFRDLCLMGFIQVEPQD